MAFYEQMAETEVREDMRQSLSIEPEVGRYPLPLTQVSVGEMEDYVCVRG